MWGQTKQYPPNWETSGVGYNNKTTSSTERLASLFAFFHLVWQLLQCFLLPCLLTLLVTEDFVWPLHVMQASYYWLAQPSLTRLQIWNLTIWKERNVVWSDPSLPWTVITELEISALLATERSNPNYCNVSLSNTALDVWSTSFPWVEKKKS